MKDGNRVSRKFTMLVISMIIVIDFFVSFVASEFTVVINTTSGPVRGEILTTVNSVKYAAFKGIRYAKAPIGYLRFKPPVPIEPWNETIDAIVDGNSCTQIDFITGILTGSEDCLFINVFTPVTESFTKNLKSVMVWIHGGAFTTGTSSSMLYRPDYLLERGVVYVSMNYRLGAMGFLNLYHGNATGNAGLKDQLLALKWVQANIEQFGGNPKNVTIFGQSAGSASVGYHILSDASAGLFHGAISMSGTPLNPWTFQTREAAFSQAVRLARILGTISVDKPTLLQTFYRASATQIVIATAKLSQALPKFTPTLEDNIGTDLFLSKCSVTKYKTGNYNKVPQILGFTDQETIAFASPEELTEISSYAIDVANEIGMPLPPGLAAIEGLIDTGIDFIDTLSDAVLSAVINETTDLLFVAQIDQTQKFLAAKKAASVYYYDFTFYTNRSLHNVVHNNGLLGAGHSDDLAFIFYFPVANYSTDPTDPLARMTDRYSTMWTNFAKYGNPTPNWINDSLLNVTWPNSGLSGNALEIGKDLKVKARPIRSDVPVVQLFSLPLIGASNGCNGLFPCILWNRFKYGCPLKKR